MNEKQGVPRRKALGQYFTGDRLAGLLARLAQAGVQPPTVVDPMCGKGDMLVAARNVLGLAPALTGVDIDPECISQARARLAGHSPVQLEVGNAFSPGTWAALGWPQFALVITNPPYVRYQTLSSGTWSELPDGAKVRANLRQVAQQLPGLSTPDRNVFLQLTEEYSGLSDLAVPAWLLCAMLVAPGGSLAMVVPETWLSRRYALPIRWLLVKLFKLRFVVEDASRTWFPGTLVKTNLIVAGRAAGVEDPPAHWKGTSYVVAGVPSSDSAGSVVASLYPESSDPDNDFARDMTTLEQGTGAVEVPFDFQLVDLGSEAASLVPVHQGAGLGGDPRGWSVRTPPPYGVPSLLRNLITEVSPRFTTLEHLGAHVGQGLRTGANAFFYADCLSDEPHLLLRAHKAVGGRVFSAPAEATRSALRLQAELPSDRLSVSSGQLRGRVLSLNGFALAEDLSRIDARLFDPALDHSDFRVIPDDLADHIRHAATVVLSGNRAIPEMSAVRTNASPKAGRFWYCLPPLKGRHTPDILIPRVNFLTPCAWLNDRRAAVVDANFSSVWLSPGAALDPLALLALLNSEWIRTSMELVGTVMGGGALKLEAIQVRGFPCPVLTDGELQALAALGFRLAQGDLLAVQAIDALVNHALSGDESSSFGDNLGNLRLRILGKRVRTMNSALPTRVPPSAEPLITEGSIDLARQPRLPHFSESKADFTFA